MRMSAVPMAVVVVLMVVVVARPGNAGQVHAVPCKRHHKTSDNGLCYSTVIPHEEVLVTVTPNVRIDREATILLPHPTTPASVATALGEGREW